MESYFSDDEDSYKKGSKNNTFESTNDLVIDETDESNQSNGNSVSLNKIAMPEKKSENCVPNITDSDSSDAEPPQFSKMVKQIRKKKAVFLSSDSEDEIFQSEISKLKSSRTSRIKSNTSVESGIKADISTRFRNKSNIETTYSTENGDSSSDTDVIKSTRGKKKSGIIDSDTDSYSESEGIKESSVTTNKTKFENLDNTKETSSRHESIKEVSLNSRKDSLNLSANMANTRISHMFRFNSEGIHNSTAIHTNLNLEQEVSPEKTFSQTKGLPKISDHSVEVLSDHDSDIIEISSDEGKRTSRQASPLNLQYPTKTVRQLTLHSFVVKAERETWQNKQSDHTPINEPSSSDSLDVTPSEHDIQKSKVASLETDFCKLTNLMSTVKLDALPDKGKLLKERYAIVENNLKEEQEKLKLMIVTKDDEVKLVPWEDLQAKANEVQPKTFGKQAMSTYNAQKALTLDRLQQLHGALQTCPKEEDVTEDPKGLKVSLMPHQKSALAWLMFREKEKPSGGILADDMGLGKTLTMLALILKFKEIEKVDDSDEENQYIGKHSKYKGGSLIVCPASLLNQWSSEIEKRLKRGLLSYELYHGPKRETKTKILAKYDVVITTYSIIKNEVEKNSPVFRIKWRRIILDEAHQIRNHKAQTSEACCQLTANSRWALTGTPMHNKELDMYALLKYLRCTPFDDLQVWKRWVGDKSSGGQERLHTVISSLMLRRTKSELMEKGSLLCLPEKKWELISVRLDKNETDIYHKVLIFSQTLFAQFLHQRAEKDQDVIDQRFGDLPNNGPNEEYFKMRQRILKLNKVKNVSQHEILVLLLRLRQICCHPSLISAMLDECKEDIGDGDEECEELNLLDQLNKLNIEEEDTYNPTNSFVIQNENEKVTLKEASKGHLNPSNPVFAKERASSKIKAMLQILHEKVLSKGDKGIIVSQWAQFLNLIAIHLNKSGIEFDQLNGSVPVNKRIGIVDRFNNPNDKMKVLLLSLTAGGVGLNLVGGNHLFLVDLHWNPQLENQAQDRIYRVGQTKSVFIYKFMATDTIEERIKALQERKLAMAEGMLTGTKQIVQSKLTLNDLKMIFGM